MPLAVGTRLGNIEIVGPLGAGGMGEVYRGRDTKLDREVAVKVLPPAYAQHPERLARFEREAKVLASLNHPNIATIYAVEESPDGKALVMELVKGQTLKGPVPVDTALKYAAQIATALDAANEKGITHRDLKPANIMVTPEGVIKVLDFGLAAVTQPSQSDGEAGTNMVTLTMSPTSAGMIMGTAAYMSPEQASGQAVDRRADIWAFGVVLWELLTGKRLFEGTTVSHILASVLKDEPDFTQVPLKVRRLLRRCLEKDPQKRLLHIGDAMELVDVDVEAAPPSATAPSQTRVGRLPRIAAAMLAVATIALAFAAYRRSTEAPPQIWKVSVELPEGAAFSSYTIPAISPDGRRIAFVATVNNKTQLWVRELDSTTAHAIAGTEDARYPFWSPDSRFVGFSDGAKLKKVDITGGPAFTLCDGGAFRGGSWGPNGIIIFGVTNRGIFQVPAAGGMATPVTTLDRSTEESTHRFPWFLPDGHHFLFTVGLRILGSAGSIFVADLDSPQPSKDRKLIANVPSNAVYTSGGYLLFGRERTVMAQPFDASKLQTTGEAVPIAEQVDLGNVQEDFQFSASQTGVLAYTSGGISGAAQLTWFDRSGKILGTVGPRRDIHWAAISPDGKTIAVDERDPAAATFDIWLHDLSRGTASRFTFGPRTNAAPVWSPDGKAIAFYAARPAVAPFSSAYVKEAGGSGRETILDQPLGDPPRPVRVDDWSRDGRFVLEETDFGQVGPNDIWVRPMKDGKPDGKAYPYLRSASAEMFARLSPNGRWLAYQGNESGRGEIYVQTFPELGGKWQVSTNGGHGPIWSRDGRELYFLGSDSKITAVEVKSVGGKPEFGVPKPLFDVRMRNDPNTQFDVSTDGRFLVPQVAVESASVPISVILNWQTGLKK